MNYYLYNNLILDLELESMYRKVTTDDIQLLRDMDVNCTLVLRGWKGTQSLSCYIDIIGKSSKMRATYIGGIKQPALDYEIDENTTHIDDIVILDMTLDSGSYRAITSIRNLNVNPSPIEVNREVVYALTDFKASSKEEEQYWLDMNYYHITHRNVVCRNRGMLIRAIRETY